MSVHHMSHASPPEAALIARPVFAVHHTLAVVLALVECPVVCEDPILVVELPLTGPALAVHRPLEVGAIPVMVSQH